MDLARKYIRTFGNYARPGDGRTATWQTRSALPGLVKECR